MEAPAGFVLDYLSFPGCLYNRQPCKVEIVSPTAIEGTFSLPSSMTMSLFVVKVEQLFFAAHYKRLGTSKLGVPQL